MAVPLHVKLVSALLLVALPPGGGSVTWGWGWEYEQEEVARAADYGLERMNQLVNVQEPRLYDMGMWLEDDNPARYVAAFNGQSPRARSLAKFGYASLQATSRLVGHVQKARVTGRLKFPTISLLNTALHDQCPLQERPVCSPASSRYRTPDGRCNNPAHPWWGASMMALHRFLPPHYKDGLERIRESVSGGPLPSARAVSAAIHSNRDIDLTTITHMVMQWGQFLDHDLTASSQSRGFNGSVPKCCTSGGHNVQPPDLTHPDCLPIVVPPDDWFYGPHGVRCLEFVRSSATSRVGCSLGPRDQINQVTSFIDASNVYGSSEEVADRLRLRRSGLLKYNRVQYRLPLLPLSAHKADLCREIQRHKECFDAGDKRVNEQPGLIALHVVWLRAHNRLATQLAHLNPHWQDERLYQEARRIVIAMMQHITYREFLPIVLGPDVVKLFDLELGKRSYYDGYDIKVNPTAANAFGTAAFRFGHSLVQHNLIRCDRSHKELPSNMSLYEELTIPSNLHSQGSVDNLLLGMCVQPAQKRDEFITEQLTNHLFQTPRYRYGMDLAALNIQRGRDHGLAPYNAWRAPCGLQPFTDWAQLLKVMSPETQRKLKQVYRDIDDIDLFPGAMAERPVIGGLVGPTFACILAQQFSSLRKGDRFWYEAGGFESSFTLAQLQQLRKVTLSRVLCDNLDTIDTLQPFVLLSADDDRNKHVSCESTYISQFDMTPWTEHHKHEDSFHHVEKGHAHYKPTTEHHHYQYKGTTLKPFDSLPTYPLNQSHYSEYVITHYKPEGPHKPHTDHSSSYPTLHGEHSYSSTKSPFHYNKPSHVTTHGSGYTKPYVTPSSSNYNHGQSPTYSKPKPHPHGEHSSTYVYEFIFKLPSPSHLESHTEHPTSYPKPHTPSYLEPKPNVEHSSSNYKPHSEHSTSYPKPHVEHSPSYSKPKPHVEHLPSYSKPKPHAEHSSNYYESHSEHSTSYPKPHVEYSPSYSKPKPHIEHSSSHHESHSEHSTSYPKPHVEHSPSYSKPKPHVEHLPSYSKPKPHAEHSSNYYESHSEHSTSYPKPHVEYSPSYSKPKPHIEHSSSHHESHSDHSISYPKPHVENFPSYSRPKPHVEHPPSYSKPKPYVDHSFSYSESHNEHSSSNSHSPSHSKPYNEHSSTYSKPHIEHSYDHTTPHSYSKPNNGHSTSYSEYEHSSSYSNPKPHVEYPPSYSTSHVEFSTSYSVNKPQHEQSSNYAKPIIIYTPSSSKPHNSYLPKPHRDSTNNHYSSANKGEAQTTLLVVDRDGPPYIKPVLLPSSSYLRPGSSPKGEHSTSLPQFFNEPIYYGMETESYQTTTTTPKYGPDEPTQYHIYLDNTALLIEGRNPSTDKLEISAENSEDWCFNADEVVDETDVPEIPTLPTDPEALNEVPHPMIITEDEDNCSRSLL